MEKKQYDLVVEILKRFHKAGILDNLILIGSWCEYFYKNHFSKYSNVENMFLKTRDIDFLIDNPRQIKKKVDIPELLKDLGFLILFHQHIH